jgi:transposase
MRLPDNTRIFVYTAATDMRRSFDRLAAMVEELRCPDWQPLGGALFVFFNRRADRVKILHWDRDGYLLIYKRLEAGRYRVPDGAPREMSALDLHLLLEGVEFTGRRQRKRYRLG